jgi:hypothetical protein
MLAGRTSVVKDLVALSTMYWPDSGPPVEHDWPALAWELPQVMPTLTLPVGQ